MAVKFNRGFNINRLVKRLLYTIIGLLVGGLLLTAFINAFEGQCSPFFNGLSLLGVNVTTAAAYDLNGTTGFSCTYAPTSCTALASSCSGATQVIGHTGHFTGGILTIVGIIAVAAIIMVEFVRW